MASESPFEKVPEEEIIRGMKSSHGYDYLFIIDKGKDKANCKMCPATFTYNQRSSGTSSLKRHLKNKHPKVSLKRQQLSSSSEAACASGTQCRLTDFPAFSKKPNIEISQTRRCILTLACSKHVLPLSFFEDSVVSKGFGLPAIDRRTVREELVTLSQEIKAELLEKNRGQWTNLILDGWKNPVTGSKHVTAMMFLFNFSSKPIFLRSYVLERCGAEEVLECIDDVVDMLKAYDIRVVSVVTDNARAMIKATTDAATKHHSIVSLRCAAHVMNLVIKDCLNQIDFMKKAFNVLLRYINQKEIRRYCETRWNSVFDRFVDLKKLLECRIEDTSSDLERVNAVVSALQPFIHVLNLAQTDGCSWPSLYRAFDDAVDKCRQRGLDGVVAVAESRRFMLLNDLVAIQQFTSGILLNLDTETENRIVRWFNALGVSDFSTYLADREFHGTSATVPRRLKLFLDHKLQQFTVSEAAVERCFSVHKSIHTPLRASLSKDMVDHILFVRYNVNWKYDIFGSMITGDSDSFDVYESFD